MDHPTPLLQRAVTRFRLARAGTRIALAAAAVCAVAAADGIG